MSINRQERQKEKIRYAFLQAAIQLILEKGYDNVTVADIVRLADYGRSTFYLYFHDKEELVWTLLQHHAQVLDKEILEATRDEESPKREWIAWYMIFANIDKQREVFLKLDGEFSRRLRQMQKDNLIKTYEQQLREGQYSILLDVPTEIAARFVVGAILELLDYWLQHPEAATAEKMADYMFRLVFREEPPKR